MWQLVFTCRNIINNLYLSQVSVNRSGKSKVIFTMGVARDFCTKLTSFANFLAQGECFFYSSFIHVPKLVLFVCKCNNFYFKIRVRN